MKKALLAAFLLTTISACASLPAQTFSLITGREPVTSLDGLWRFHTGDNPAWARPNFDDSHCPLLRSDENWAMQGYKGYSGFAWYRFRVAIPAGMQHVSLLLPALRTSYQVYADGDLSGSFGEMPPHGVAFYSRPAEYELNLGNSPGPREVTIALRVWHWSGWSRYYGGGPSHAGSLVGQSSVIHTQFQRLRDSRVLSTGGDYSVGLLEAICGTIALLLFLVRRRETEYLWFALNQLADAALSGVSIYETFRTGPVISQDWLLTGITLISTLAFIFFLQTLLLGRRSALFYVAVAAALASPLLYFLLFLHIWPSVGAYNMSDAAFSLLIFVWSCDLLVRRAKEGLPDARLLLAPVLIAVGLNCADRILWGAFQLGWLRASYLPFTLVKSPFLVTADDLIMVLFLIAMLAILTNRFMRSRREEQRMAGEFEAARNVQSLLVPASAPSTPGFAVDSVYLPASEVGGDFFHVQPGDDGSLLLVVGDVSGKGLTAAMTVSAIIGALRDEKTRQPAQVLAHLNRVLCGHIGGFVTCSATLVADNGATTIANAGNLPPYRNGEELPVPSGLPLGIVAEVTYDETRFELAPGDRLTFVSDGVAEARDAKGELLGFERMAGLTGKRAMEIAETAQRWGQQDDITVLTVTRAANMEAAIA